MNAGRPMDKKNYYSDKIASLKDIFGTENLSLEPGYIVIDNKKYPIVKDVIIMLEPSKWPETIRKGLGQNSTVSGDCASKFAEDIQFTFGAEWKKYPSIVPNHRDEFNLYFDLVNLENLKNMRVCDLGCGIGRWSYFLQDKCRELVLIDFSEAIFISRNNLRDCNHVIYIMDDINNLRLREKFADFLFCLGVLHHIPGDALEAARRLKKHSSSILIYLYYSLDNKPSYFHAILAFVTSVRLAVSRIRNEYFRSAFTYIVAIFVYWPLIMIGKFFNMMDLSVEIPIYEGYKGKTMKRIRQDVYDRFFTRIEQRFSRKDIMTLKDTYKDITVSESIPYWHFLCKDVLKIEGK